MRIHQPVTPTVVVSVLRYQPSDRCKEGPAYDPAIAMGLASTTRGPEAPDLADGRGQELAKHTLVIAVTGGHNLLLKTHSLIPAHVKSLGHAPCLSPMISDRHRASDR